ncbi:hypothetical protein CYLTODRAFT_453426 [Cylindrobasidium torrendii FP15055 ss-10]|uniref:Uncharacterized protein n=1 Tax=Cylindrobasidium torrendii FP15055 ss-10 TaxID=1314674 RepID=A0A0D7BFY8_9AGAR|nr:hypothetical protein CYLTODRAFT_453426 [Cylindrobasidium torrendii FP15055 ss-10]
MAREDPTHTRKCPICKLKGVVWESSPPSDDTTARKLVYWHVRDKHSGYRYFCNVSGCNYSVAYADKPEIKNRHARTEHGGGYEGETLRDTSVASQAASSFTTANIAVPSTSTSQGSSYISQASPTPAPFITTNLHPVVPAANVTTFSTLNDAI